MTPATTFSDSSGTPNANPIILNSAGRCRIYLDPLISYAFVITDSLGVQVGLTMDPVSLNMGALTSASFKASALGSASAPPFSFVNDADTGMFSPGANILAFSTGAAERVRIHASGGVSIGNVQDLGAGFLLLGPSPFTILGTYLQLPGNVSLLGGTIGAGAFPGRRVSVGANTSGSGAAGTLQLTGRTGGDNYVWADASSSPGQLRISTAAPEEDGTPADTSGTVVGTQVSWHEAKRNIEPTHVTADEALTAVLDAQIYDFEYKGDGYQDANGQPAQFTGFVGFDRADWFLMNVGPQQTPALNAITIPGYFALAFKALQAQIDDLKAELAAWKAMP